MASSTISSRVAGKSTVPRYSAISASLAMLITTPRVCRVLGVPGGSAATLTGQRRTSGCRSHCVRYSTAPTRRVMQRRRWCLGAGLSDVDRAVQPDAGRLFTVHEPDVVDRGTFRYRA